MVSKKGKILCACLCRKGTVAYVKKRCVEEVSENGSLLSSQRLFLPFIDFHFPSIFSRHKNIFGAGVFALFAGRHSSLTHSLTHSLQP
jgi:hypothetical protein